MKEIRIRTFPKYRDRLIIRGEKPWNVVVLCSCGIGQGMVECREESSYKLSYRNMGSETCINKS
jgi:hypothetical protein